LLLALLALLLPACAGCRRTVGKEPFRQAALASARAKTTTRAEVISYPQRILVRAALTPSDLERRGARAWIDLAKDPAFREQLASALESPDLVQVPTPALHPDFRWACILHDAKGNRVLAMYLDGFGQKGLIGGTPVASKGNAGKLAVVAVLEKAYAPPSP
jgi:hypothetical protein